MAAGLHLRQEHSANRPVIREPRLLPEVLQLLYALAIPQYPIAPASQNSNLFPLPQQPPPEKKKERLTTMQAFDASSWTWSSPRRMRRSCTSTCTWERSRSSLPSTRRTPFLLLAPSSAVIVSSRVSRSCVLQVDKIGV
ncbi:hypothetical protein BHE74_00043738 [Ensete ventricosum]|nr:hypothetical protein BHE74_00043738 [Ensete ventricosum]